MSGRHTNPLSWEWLLGLLAVVVVVVVVVAAERMQGPLVDSTTAITTTTSRHDSSSTTVAVSEVLDSTEVPSPGEDVPLEFDDVYRWIWVDPDSIRVVWRDENGEPFGQLEAARQALEANGERVIAMTNGGIHRPELVPSGLHIEGGSELVALNRGTGSGNFFLEPNGVFWVGGGRAVVETTDQFAAGDGGQSTATYALQSGPMLVIDGAVNPVFLPTSNSTHRRNAVGVDAAGRVLLILANKPVTLWEMADRCRRLGAVNALYLDGSLSRFDHVADGRPIFPNVPVASMIAVVEERDS